MGVPMTMPMTMPVIMAVVMAMVMMAKSCHAYKIHCQAEAANNEQLSKPLSFSALNDPFKSFNHDFHANETVHEVRIHGSKLSSGNGHLHQEDTIREATQCFHFTKTIWEARTGRPLARDSSKETNGKSDAIEKHMDAVRQEAKRVGDVAIKSLDCHEREVKTVQVAMSALDSIMQSSQSTPTS